MGVCPNEEHERFLCPMIEQPMDVECRRRWWDYTAPAVY
jgi:hypothetical protein